MIAADVTAVVLCWNDAERVRVLLESLALQEPRPRHVIVVDNGSHGGAPTDLGAAFPGCRVIALGRNLGFAAAANRGMAEALQHGAAWVWLLNSDLVLPASALATLLAEGEGDARCGLVGALLRNVDGSVQARGGGSVNLRTGAVRHAVGTSDRIDYLSGACLLLRGPMLREVGLFDEGYFFSFEDVDLGLRARDAGWSLAVAEDCDIVHQEAGSLGAWSRQRWFHLFRGLARLLESRSPRPRTALALRVAVHTVTMARHGRVDAVRGAWMALAGGSGTGTGPANGGVPRRQAKGDDMDGTTSRG